MNLVTENIPTSLDHRNCGAWIVLRPRFIYSQNATTEDGVPQFAAYTHGALLFTNFKCLKLKPSVFFNNHSHDSVCWLDASTFQTDFKLANQTTFQSLIQGAIAIAAEAIQWDWCHDTTLTSSRDAEFTLFRVDSKIPRMVRLRQWQQQSTTN